ncbi:sideroflexin-4 [Pelodytes ibericus]
MAELNRSIYRRCLRWLDVLDPTTIFTSDEDIKNAKTMLENLPSPTENTPQDSKVNDAMKMCQDNLAGAFDSTYRKSSLSPLRQVCLHPDTGNIIPPIFRPPAYMPIALPLVVTTLLPHKGPTSAFFSQILFQSYSAGFNLQNGNKTFDKDKVPFHHSLILVGSVLYAACVGATPQFIMKKYKLTSPGFRTFFGKVLPPPLLAGLAAFNVVAVRVPEVEHGIEVVDKTGKVVGVSPRAGKKAVMETAVSRAVLVGVTAVMPVLIEPILRGSRFLLGPVKFMLPAMVFGMLIPVSFSLFPQKGMIRTDTLEEELQANTTDSELYYHRGL